MAHINMTLTSPGCPSGAEIMEEARRVVSELDGITAVEVELVWDPYWTPEKMDPRVKAFLGYVTRHGFALFAWWRVIVGTLGLMALAMGR